MNHFQERKEAPCPCHICEHYAQHPEQAPLQIRAKDERGREVFVTLRGKNKERFQAFMEQLQMDSSTS